MTLADYKIVLYRQLDGDQPKHVMQLCQRRRAGVHQRAASADGRHFGNPGAAEEHAERGRALPADTTRIVQA